MAQDADVVLFHPQLLTEVVSVPTRDCTGNNPHDLKYGTTQEEFRIYFSFHFISFFFHFILFYFSLFYS